jgi:hypothetical protein
LLLVALLATACSSGSDAEGGSDAKGDAITFDGQRVKAAEFVDELRVIAANDELAKVLEQNDTVLVPKPDTIDPLMVQSWVYHRINQFIIDEAFEQRQLEVTPAIRRQARRELEEIFRGKEAFDAFPEDFQELVIDRQAKIVAVNETLPKELVPTDADLRELYTRIERTCQQDKLVSQIWTDSKADADAIAAQLAQGADFATLARERSTDETTKGRGGLTMCIGSSRWNASVEPVKQAVEATAVGGTTAPIGAADGWTIVRVLPLTFENARPLVADDWKSRHPSALFDFLRAARDAGDATIQPRFGSVLRQEGGIAYAPPTQPPRL